jgi:hypothetical protein
MSSNRRLVESAQRTVSKLLGEDCDELGCPSDVADEIVASAGEDAPLPDEVGDDHAEEERTEVAIAKDLQTLIPDLKGINGPEGAEEATERVNALAVELLAMHGVDVDIEDVGDEAGDDSDLDDTDFGGEDAEPADDKE